MVQKIDAIRTGEGGIGVRAHNAISAVRELALALGFAWDYGKARVVGSVEIRGRPTKVDEIGMATLKLSSKHFRNWKSTWAKTISVSRSYPEHLQPGVVLNAINLLQSVTAGTCHDSPSLGDIKRALCCLADYEGSQGPQHQQEFLLEVID